MRGVTVAESSTRKQHSEWAGPGAPAGFTVVSPHSIQMCELSWPLRVIQHCALEVEAWWSRVTSLFLHSLLKFPPDWFNPASLRRSETNDKDQEKGQIFIFTCSRFSNRYHPGLYPCTCSWALEICGPLTQTQTSVTVSQAALGTLGNMAGRGRSAVKQDTDAGSSCHRLPVSACNCTVTALPPKLPLNNTG